MKSGNLNFLEPSGPLQACNETALPLLISYHIPYVNLEFYCKMEYYKTLAFRLLNYFMYVILYDSRYQDRNM